jgi:hypothetical protein
VAALQEHAHRQFFSVRPRPAARCQPYFIILPDASAPENNQTFRRPAFPQYNYEDMIRASTASYRTPGRASFALSFGKFAGGTDWLWGDVSHFMDALVPLACHR